MSVAAVVSFRLGHPDGVSVVAQQWVRALTHLGFGVYTVAGEGRAELILPELAIDATRPPTHHDVADALAEARLVVVENLLTIPLNLPASRVVAEVLRGRPAILHHHDPPWQRARFAHVTELPPDDPAWRHVTINDLTRRELAERGITAVTILNGFDTTAPDGNRRAGRRAVRAADDERVFLHPVRAIARKNVPAALALAEAAGATYWLLGPAEEGYGPDLDRILAAARTRVVRGVHGCSVADAYAAADLVLFPSTWEGFGNPPIEAALHGRPCVVGDYPVAAEVTALGFDFLPVDPAAVAAWLANPDPAVLARNRDLARTHFSLARVTQDLGRLLTEAGWLPGQLG